jgi:hypothetical protein
MKEKRIKYLLSRYYQGISTEGEEEELRKFFSSESINGYEAEKELFAGYDDLAVIPEPSEDFEEKIILSIDHNNSKTTSKANGTNIWIKTIWINIAAMALAIIGTYLFLANYNKPVDTYDDPYIAYIESVKIYSAVSDKLNIGLSALEQIPKVTKVAAESIGQVDHSVSNIMSSLDNIGSIGGESHSITFENN